MDEEERGEVMSRATVVARSLRQLYNRRSRHWHPQDPDYDETIDERIRELEREEW